ncbi:sporulation protein YhbH [Paenibacillus sp. YN15]|uniref:sporulation protein YhbH n=1 Tax=Paenibacillus sp. YN15 TaxID=1742774 RepID=UPI000DCCDF1C|nr:sporulation protein YhbH [Paenibacillus sp. YN15]RAU99561.1 sporulation protein YhbH [Paenibacillus sp. YN15]
MQKPLFVLSRDDWSLHRKGERDQERHARKVKEAIRKNLKELVSEEAIITSQGERIVKVPIREMDEPRFRYDYGREQRVGQGNGGTKAGDVIGRASPNGQQPGQGQEGQPGEQPGVDYYEAEVTVDELAELIFEDLQLPRLQRKSEADMSIDDIRFNDIRKKGMMGNIDKRRTLLESLKRRSLAGGGGAGNGYGEGAAAAWSADAGGAGLSPEAGASFSSGPSGWSGTGQAGLIKNEDMRFKTWEDIRKPQSNAVVLAMMDTSGSMGSFEKYIARSFYFWMVRFLRTRYERVEVCFLAHDTEAKQVSEEAFFTKGESGGTRCSSVYSLALDLLAREYPVSAYNAYAFHFTDGDNIDSDNALSVELVKQLLLRTNLMGYGEIRRYMRASRLWDSLSAVRHEAFTTSVLQEKGDVYRTLKQFFGEHAVS